MTNPVDIISCFAASGAAKLEDFRCCRREKELEVQKDRVNNIRSDSAPLLTPEPEVQRWPASCCSLSTIFSFDVLSPKNAKMLQRSPLRTPSKCQMSRCQMPLEYDLKNKKNEG